MSDGYKNILANGYMRDTNYIIIKDCDNIDELNIQWNKFLSNMTVRQQRLSDDKSIEIWNITNQQHYKIQKQQFLEKLKKKDIEGNKEIIPSNIVDLNDDTPDSIFSSGDFDEFKKDIDLNDPKYYTEDNNINLTLPDDIKDDPNDNAMEFNQDSTMSIVGNIKGNNVEDKLKNLEKEFIRFNSQSNNIKRKADDKCRELYGGSSNLDRYNKLKSEYLSNKTKETPEPKDFIPPIEPQDNSDNDEIKCNEKICRCHYNDSSAVTEALHNDSFIARCYSAYILNSINEASDHKEMKRLEDVPYFTPQELIDLGVHGNNNYYSKMSDNDGLTKDISISTWFDSYKDLSMNHIFEDYRKEWINKLNELYSDYYDIKDEDKLLARKQSILDLGWNPEIPFTNENRIKASNRVNEIFKQTTPNDVFIDMSNIPELKDDNIIAETVDDSHEPVFLVLTKGKTPIISQGIKFVTNSEYSHASITFDPELEEVYSFNMRKESFGFVKENKSSFKENFISVFAFFAPKNIVNKLKETVYDFGNHKTTFDLKIFANKIFHINHKASNNEYNQVCSTFVDTVLQSGGINLVGDQKIPAPSDIYNGAKSEPNKIFEVYNGIAPKYDGKKVKRQINYLRTNQDTLSINEACKDIKTARKFVNDVGKLSKKYNANYFIVTDGASGIHNNGNPAVKNARDAQIKWENENGGDPDEDWSNDFKNESTEISDIYYNDENISERNDYMLENDQEINRVIDICNKLHDEWSKFEYGIPINGHIKNIPSAEYYNKNYKFLSPDKFKKYGGGVCWDYVEYGSKFLDKYNIKYHQIYIITDTPPDYETHTILICEVGNKYVYTESSFELVDKYINGVSIFKSIEEILKLITSMMFEVNNNKKKFKSFKYDAIEFSSVPQYGCDTETYMNYMKNNGKYIYQGIAKPFNKSKNESTLLEAQLPEGVSLRNATENDTDNMFKWEMESVDKNNRKDPKVIKAIKDDVKESIHDTKMIMYNDQVIGMFTSCMLNGGIYWYIGEIYIINEHRNKGIGSTLLKNEVDKHNKIKLQVSQSNSSAIKLYKSLGFKISETNDKNKMYIMILDKTSKKESFSFVNEDYTFVKYKNKDNLYSKGKELYDSLPKQDKEFLGGHYIDSKNIYYRKIYTSGKDITGFGELYIFDSSPNDAILMYAVSPDYRNKGLSNKILNDIFDFCKKDKNIHSIIWRANKNNDASNYLANKYKMKLIHSDDRDNKYSMVFNESFSYINEVKKFPIEFDDNGNLTIYKCRMGNISYGDEIDDSSELLESYRNTNNIEGMKYEVSRLWFIISDIEKKMTKRIDSKKYDEYVRNRATATNIFKHNLEYLMKMDKDFNFAEYYNTTPFSNNSVKITNNTLKYSMKTLQQFIMK